MGVYDPCAGLCRLLVLPMLTRSRNENRYMSDKSGISRQSILRRNRAIWASSDVNSTWSSSLVYTGTSSCLVGMVFFSAGSLSRLVYVGEKEIRRLRRGGCVETKVGVCGEGKKDLAVYLRRLKKKMNENKFCDWRFALLSFVLDFISPWFQPYRDLLRSVL